LLKLTILRNPTILSDPTSTSIPHTSGHPAALGILQALLKAETAHSSLEHG
jgi:hypothetical protein